MERLARLSPLRQFGRLRHLRAPRDCAVIGAAARVRGLSSTVQSVRPTAVASTAAADVRVYRSASRVIMVGTIDAVCEMIDRCIAEENAGITGGLFDRAA